MLPPPQFLISPQEQQKRLEKWQSYWTNDRKKQVYEDLETAAAGYCFRPGSFDSFRQWLDGSFHEYVYNAQSEDLSSKLLNEWQTSADSITMLISQVRVSETAKRSSVRAVQQRERCRDLRPFLLHQ